jgi:hypothetical protein
LEQRPAQLPCNKYIDYSQVTGDRILPFVFELDTEASNLDPGPGKNQRFCYNVIGNAKVRYRFANLCYFILGICDQITMDQIAHIEVRINGIKQKVVFGEGGNVQLLTPQRPDPITRCAGLKFDFELNKAGDHMKLCYELNTPYPVGPNPVCLFGGGVTAKGLSICGPACEQQQGTCEAAAYQPLSVSVPVTVRPFVNKGSPTTYCCGEPIVDLVSAECEEIDEGACSFVITQKLCVKVPITFGATASVGSTFVQCGQATNEDVCTGCGTTNAPPTDNQCERETYVSGLEAKNQTALETCIKYNNRLLLDSILD